MPQKNRGALGSFYAQAWYAYKGQAIAVSVDHVGMFDVHFNNANTDQMPEWRGKMRLKAFLESLGAITLHLQGARIRSQTECGLKPD